MNIFILDHDIELSAQYHNDSHVIKMILESVQMLSTANHLHNLEYGYKPTHVNHPCTKWVCESYSNWDYLYSLAFHLNQEYRYRFGKLDNHKSWDMFKHTPVPRIKDIGLTPFAQAMPTAYQCDCAKIGRAHV